MDNNRQLSRTAPWKKALTLAVLCLLTLALYPLTARLSLGEWAFPFDDPWTHQVYARNLVEHGQYAFNLGQPSTGSSAPLWTVLQGPAHALGLPVVPCSLALGLLSLAALGWVAWSWAERRLPPPLPALLTTALLLSPQVAWGGVQGMETALVSAAALLVLWRLDGPRWSGGSPAFLDGALNGLLLWLRPEAPLLMMVVLWQRRRERLVHLLALGGGYLLLALPYLALNWLAGGRPLPQTVYAKVAFYGRPLSLGSLASFLGDLFWTLLPGVWPLVLVLVVVAVARMARRREWPWGPGLAWASLTVLAAALRLPVVLHFGRHLAPILPPLVLAAGEGLLAVRDQGRRSLCILGLCLVLIGLVIGVGFYRPACQLILDSQVAMGRWIDANLPAEAVVATHDIGAIGYFGRRPLVDTLALITPELTAIVAAGDTAGLQAYLRAQGVEYLATLQGVYRPIQEDPESTLLVQRGRMVLLRLAGTGQEDW